MEEKDEILRNRETQWKDTKVIGIMKVLKVIALFDI
jgi:hypothetical protein